MARATRYTYAGCLDGPDAKAPEVTEGEVQIARHRRVRIIPLVGVEQIQLVQHTLHDIEARLVMREPLTAAHEQALTTFIQRNLGHPFTLRFSVVETIRHAVNGKVEAFISLLPRPDRP